MLAPAAMSRNASQAHAYRRVGVETGVDAATPHQLVIMLFDGFIDAIAQARSALERRDIEAKCKAISRAARIVDEGLKAWLDFDAGGKLARRPARALRLRRHAADPGQPEQRRRRARRVPEPARAGAFGLGSDRSAPPPRAAPAE